MSGYRHSGLTEREYWDMAALAEAAQVIQDRYADCSEAMNLSAALLALRDRINKESEI